MDLAEGASLAAAGDGTSVGASQGCDVASLRKVCQQVNPSGPKAQGFQRGGFNIANFLPQNNFDEIFPRLILGDQVLGLDPKRCAAQGITHVLNAAQGSKFGNVNTQESMFTPHGIQYMGVAANDNMAFDLSKFFEATTKFIVTALEENETNKIYIHCVQGISRSATILCAFLMMERGFSAVEALTALRRKRAVCPNEGFLRQLCKLDEALKSKAEAVDDKN